MASIGGSGADRNETHWKRKLKRHRYPKAANKWPKLMLDAALTPVDSGSHVEMLLGMARLSPSEQRKFWSALLQERPSPWSLLSSALVQRLPDSQTQ
jgi:hypothetical protein